MDDEHFKIPYIPDTITNSTDGHQLQKHYKNNLCIIGINEEDPIMAKGALDELQRYQTLCSKSEVNISLCMSKSY